jgi:hypothetical protein
MIGGMDLHIHPLADLGPVIPAWSCSQQLVAQRWAVVTKTPNRSADVDGVSGEIQAPAEVSQAVP